MKKNALVLQGGGALGAYQLGVIRYIYEKQPNFFPEIVTGVSIGAVNAAVMIGGKKGPVDSLEMLWNTVKMATIPFFPQEWQAKSSKLGNPHMYFINPTYVFAPLVAQSIYDVSPFYQVLEDLIDMDQLNQSATKVVLESVNIESGELQRFSNQPDPEKGEAGPLDIKHIISSMSIPPNFPAVEIGMNYYWDGGLYANMPLSPAINYLESLGGDTEDIQRNIIIINLFRKQSKLPTTLTEISDRIKELMFESKINLDKKTFERIDSYRDLIQDIDKVLPADSPLKNRPAYKQLMGYKKINFPVTLQYRAEGVEGTDDFTPDSIDFRIRKGYYDAQNNKELLQIL